MQILNLHANFLFEGSKPEGIFFPFWRKISFILAGSAWTSCVSVAGSVFATAWRSRRITALVCFGLWVAVDTLRMDSPFPLNCPEIIPFRSEKRGSTSWNRQRVGVWAGKFCSINSWLAFVEWGVAKSCSNIRSLLRANSFRWWTGRPLDFFRDSTHPTTFFNKRYQNILENNFVQNLLLVNASDEILCHIYIKKNETRHNFPQRDRVTLTPIGTDF